MKSYLSKFGATVVLMVALSSTGFSQRGGGARTFKNLEYARVGSTSLLLDLYLPTVQVTGKIPCVVWIHGGGWYSGSKENPTVSTLTGQGYALVSINYRLTGEAPFPAQIYDCKAAVRWVRANASRYNIDSNRIGAIGFSAGGHLASLLGTSGGVASLEGNEGNASYSSSVQVVVDGYGPSDFPTMIPAIEANPDQAVPGGLTNVEAVDKLLAASTQAESDALVVTASPTTYVKAGNPPFYIFHGTADLTCPYQQSQLLNSKLRGVGAKVNFTTVQNAGHGVWNSQISSQMLSFLNTNLKNLTTVSPTFTLSSFFGFPTSGSGALKNGVINNL